MQPKQVPKELVGCPGCGFVPAPEAKFCSECGRPLRVSLAPPLPAVAQPPRRARGTPGFNRAERRQLTVMFCDMVGSTELSSRMDPEELGELLGRYRARVQSEVENHGGTTARFFGDGVLVYFGYPFAQEDDAIRAVRAALGIVRGLEMLVERPAERLGERSGSLPLQVHLGIHTGMVLIDRTPGVGGMGGVGDIIGETPNVAAKVQMLAPPATVLVSSTTHALTSDLFDYAPWGPLELKGFSPSIELHRLIGERDWRREDSASRGRAKQFFGRTQETTRLGRLWREALGGSGRVATIVGEPGIGKTRLTQWTADHAEASGAAVLRFYCAAEAIDTPFWPVSETIASICRLEGHAHPTQLHRLRRAALRAGLPQDDFVPAVADMLFGPLDPAECAPLLKLTAEGRRQRLVELLLDWVANLAAETPLLLVVENVHWADPSSRALLAELARRAGGMRLLLLVTARPQPAAPLADIGGIDRLVLDRLPAHDLEAMLTALWRDAILPSDMQRHLLDRCDGVPLFLEQLVKTVAERVNRGGGAGLPDVPTSLRDMLAARLDRLGPAKLIALAASVIGRQFSARLLRALLPRRAAEVESGLALLVQADIIRPVGGTAGKLAEPAYKFRHALLRDAAYDSLLRSERVKYHRTLARAYRRHYATLVEAQPELVARHISAAGEAAEALEYWWKAALRARARSANREAMAHFRSGIADAERIEDPEESHAQLIRFTMAAARAALSADGFASPEVERLNNRALALVERASSTQLLPAALGAVFSYYQVRGPLQHARASAERLLQLAAGQNDRAVLARNKRRLGWVEFCRGEIRASTALLAEALDDARHLPPNELGLAEGDALIIGMVNLGWAESFAGDLGSAVQRCAESVALARRRYAERDKLTHDIGSLPGDLAYALCLAAAVAKQAQDPRGVMALAGEARDFAISHELPYWRAWSTVLLGWGVAHDEPERGTALLVEGIAAYTESGARLFVPYNLALLAEAHMAYGRVTEGRACVAEALEASEETGACFMDSELLRIQARLMAQAGDTEAALQTLTHAVTLAERHGASTIRNWAERDHRYLIDGTRGPPGLLLATIRGAGAPLQGEG
jgi:class 3 adenylate cyclase